MESIIISFCFLILGVIMGRGAISRKRIDEALDNRERYSRLHGMLTYKKSMLKWANREGVWIDSEAIDAIYNADLEFDLKIINKQN